MIDEPPTLRSCERELRDDSGPRSKRQGKNEDKKKNRAAKLRTQMRGLGLFTYLIRAR
jgi:hypothetical protein